MNKKNVLIMVVAMVLVAVVSVGGTVAWLTAKTETITNTFTVGNINIALDETENDYKIVPGTENAKDPKVTVQAGSEKCWVFVKVEETIQPNTLNFEDYITYSIADGWTELTAGSGIYYREYTGTAVAEYPVLDGNKVTYSKDITKDMMDKLTANPTLSFTAYAIQKEKFGTAAAAWAEVSNATYSATKNSNGNYANTANAPVSGN